MYLPHICEVRVHRLSGGEVVLGAAHEAGEERVCDGLLAHGDEQRRGQVAHALHVARLQVLPHVAVDTNIIGIFH